MKRLWCFAVISPLLGLALTTAYGEAPTVAVDNGDVEKRMDNWEGSGVIATDVKHGGEKSLLLEKGHVYQPPGKKRLIWIEPGHDYRARGFSQADLGWGPDSESLEFARKHGGDASNLSAPNVDMVIDVANRVRQKHPEAKFSTIAYQWSFSPPADMTIPDYVMVVLAPIHADFGELHNSPKNKSIGKDIQGWAKISNNLYVWDWGIQMTLDNLPPDGKWKLYASVRVDPGSGPNDAIGFTVGVHAPFGNHSAVKVSEVADGKYHTFELRGSYINDAGTFLWFAPPNSSAIGAMYVDRVVAVRVGERPRRQCRRRLPPQPTQESANHHHRKLNVCIKNQ